MHRFSQRLIFSLSASHGESSPFLRDISRAYTQSDTHLEIDVNIRPPQEMGMNDGTVLKVETPLYGIP